MMTRVIKVDPKAIDMAAIETAARVIEEGGLVAFPTETVYGLAASLLNKKALSRLTEIKQRPADKSFSIHIPEAGYAERYAQEILPSAYKIMDKFWPGPVTVVLKSPGDKSVGLRVPDHEIACQLLRRVDGPVIAPSANPAGQTSPTKAQQVLAYFDGKIELLLDGGSTSIGVESTVVEGRYQQVVVVDPTQKTLVVYHVELSTGAVELCSVRNITWDLQMTHYNGKSPLPSEIQSILEHR